MTEETKDCPRCRGRGAYADKTKDPLTRLKCERCDGTGQVPADSPDEEPADEAKQIPFGSQ